ncbi:MAG: HAMP domain-containing methyl-accepting chemotaxis protein [Pseudomonadota bacterium]|nr:HAMP domain-containing methyl-accepting chemotaxis protein [Pseudomonadota bacterium]
MKSSIKTQFLLPALSMMAIGLLAVGGYAALSRANMQNDMFQKKVDLTAQLVLSGSSNAIWQFDEAMAKETLAPATTDPDFRAGVIFDEKGNPFYSIGEASIIDELSKSEGQELDGSLLVESVPLLRTEEGQEMTIGRMAIVFDTSAAAASSFQSMLTMVTLAGGVLILSSLALFVFVSRIGRSIGSLSDVMRRMSGGQFDLEVPGIARSDELGDMAKAVNVLRDNSLKALALESETQEMRSRDEAQQAIERERKEQEAAQLREATELLGSSLAKLSSGDLTCRIETALAAQYEPIRGDFNKAVDQLSDALKSVMVSVGNIDAGTDEIAASGESLAKRTEQQAAALEETAAALDEITANVSNSTKRTGEVRSASRRVNTAAIQSTEVVSRAEDAMQRIERSSEKISNIIGVIDEIAFQINLLALNAGVEAARAGESGKSFAVVAQEVRELAQRSALAANEIKTLITTSASEVDSGAQLVRETGTGLKEISRDIAEITVQMDAIAMSAQEQATGLGQINSAIGQMDKVTQQNATMVEESSAAASTLAREASKLRELIAGFVVDDPAKLLRETAHRMERATTSEPGAESDSTLKRLLRGVPVFGR